MQENQQKNCLAIKHATTIGTQSSENSFDT